MRILKIFGTYLIQPLLWLGVIFSGIIYAIRIKEERKNFRIGLNKDWYEIRHFIKKGLTWGILGSLISLILGITLSTNMIGQYEFFAFLALLFLPLIDLSDFALLFAGIIGCMQHSFVANNFLILLAFSYFVKTRLVGKNDQIWFSPRKRNGKRGRKIIEYYWHEFSVLPLLIFIPNNGNYTSIFPILRLGDLKFSLFILPLFIGSVGKILKETSHQALQNYRRQNLMLMVITLVCYGLSLLFAKFALVFFVIILMTSIGIHLYQRIQDKKADQWYVQTNSGIRIVAIRPQTPAAKMNLEPGDIILNCNGRAINDENQFYAALQLNSAYCHLKVKTFDGDLKITEGAIYNDSPYELGIVLF